MALPPELRSALSDETPKPPIACDPKCEFRGKLSCITEGRKALPPGMKVPGYCAVLNKAAGRITELPVEKRVRKRLSNLGY